MELQTERLSLRPMSDAELQTLMEAVRPCDTELADAYNDMLRAAAGSTRRRACGTRPGARIGRIPASWSAICASRARRRSRRSATG